MEKTKAFAVIAIVGSILLGIAMAGNVVAAESIMTADCAVDQEALSREITGGADPIALAEKATQQCPGQAVAILNALMTVAPDQILGILSAVARYAPPELLSELAIAAINFKPESQSEIYNILNTIIEDRALTTTIVPFIEPPLDTTTVLETVLDTTTVLESTTSTTTVSTTTTTTSTVLPDICSQPNCLNHPAIPECSGCK